MSTTKVKLAHPNAVIPYRGTEDSTGYDLVAVEKFKDVDSVTTLYETGVIIEPPKGFYFEIVPRSSIVKSGYFFTNSVGVIDRDFRGTMKIALTKARLDAEPLKTPFTICQLILRRKYDTDFELVEDLSETKRGDGGFGSTGSRV